LKSTQVTCHCQVKSSQVECNQVDRRRLGVDFSLKSGHVSVTQRLTGLDNIVRTIGVRKLMSLTIHAIYISSRQKSLKFDSWFFVHAKSVLPW